MAKRKLSDPQRKALRQDIQAKLSSGMPRRDLVRTLSTKYRISPISMRWYLRTQPAALAAGDGNASAGPLAAAGLPNASGEALARSLLGEAPGNGGRSVVDMLSGLTPQKIRRLIQAKKLIPKLQVFRRHESAIRGRIRRLEKQLESELGKARGVEAQIKRLAGL
jgi:hypothetical protein